MARALVLRAFDSLAIRRVAARTMPVRCKTLGEGRKAACATG